MGTSHAPSSATWEAYPDYEHEDESSELAALPHLPHDEAASEVYIQS